MTNILKKMMSSLVLVATLAILFSACQKVEDNEVLEPLNTQEHDLNLNKENAQCGACLILDDASSKMTEAERVDYYASFTPEELLDLLNKQDNSEVNERGGCNWYYYDKYCSWYECTPKYSGYLPDMAFYYDCNYKLYNFCTDRNDC